MSRSLMSTQVNISLVLVANIRTDAGNKLTFAHLADVTPILFYLWSLGQWLTSSGAICAARVVYAYDLIIEWLAEPVELPWSKTWLKTWLKTPAVLF